MIKSMTGFGKAIVELPGKKITVEVKSLNSKQLDASIKIPSTYKDKELEIRTEITKILERGKIDFYLTVEISGDQSNYAINKPLVLHYYKELKSLSEEVGENAELLPSILKMPDVLKTVREDIDEEEWRHVQVAIADALHQADRFRIEEGALLSKDFEHRIELIRKYMNDVTPFEKARVPIIRERLMHDISELADSSKFDPNRFEQELIYYIEKLDITEEKVRLAKHIDYFLNTLNEAGSQGKKLAFITQELGREINTMGSKANDADIQKLVVQMKDELEKIKEQLMNIL
ncbi:MAG: YicC/YloC family endoribonuclease [Bacteroidota bacterium]|nr:YicC/YloC family endoribonuclease [Bacteroidota bacterium]